MNKRRQPLPAIRWSTDPKAAAPCHACSALCCRYFTVQIDPPEDDEDFDHIKWYIIHEDAWVFASDGEWFVQVERPCKFLSADNQCTIYERRPQICRDYGLPEKLDSPDDPLCDYFSTDLKHEIELRTMEQVEAYRAQRLHCAAHAHRRITL